MRPLISGMCLMTTLAILAGCDQSAPAKKPSTEPAQPKVTAKDVDRETGEAAEAAGEYLSQKKDEFMGEMNKKLSGMDEQIEKMKVRGKELQGEAKVKWEAALKDMEEKRAEMAVKMDKWKESSGKAWEDMKGGLENAWTDLQHSWDKASEHFEEPKKE